jgi:SAM-dependent methyltransferase
MSDIGRHYRGDQGARYFQWQRRSGAVGAGLNAEKFHRHIRPTDTVADFGCGAGLMLERLAAAARIGIEPNEHARAATAARDMRVVASAADLPDESVDIVVSNHALEHTLNPAAELRELRRILRPGGRLILWLPIDDWRTQRNSRETDTNHHFYTWTPLLLRNLLEEVGFEVREVRVVAHAWPPKTPALMRFLPRRAWDLLAWLTAVVRRSRQLEAVCVRC